MRTNWSMTAAALREALGYIALTSVPSTRAGRGLVLRAFKQVQGRERGSWEAWRQQGGPAPERVPARKGCNVRRAQGGAA